MSIKYQNNVRSQLILHTYPKIQLFFSKFKKKFLNFQLQIVEYSDTRIWKF